jgi:PAS domain-containing protein
MGRWTSQLVSGRAAYGFARGFGGSTQPDVDLSRSRRARRRRGRLAADRSRTLGAAANTGFELDFRRVALAHEATAEAADLLLEAGMAPPNRINPEADTASPDEDAEASAGANVDLSMLIKMLGEADRRLEELTGAEIDLVTDQEGRSYLLRRAQERWRRAAADQQAVILDALPTSIALLNIEAVILSVNERWRRSADRNSLHDPDYGIGSNYLDVCDRARGADAAEAAEAAAGLRSVLAGSAETFSMEYACHGPTEDHWFQLTVTPVRDHFPMAAVVMHHDITARKRAEEEMYRFSAAMEASLDGIQFIDRAQMRVIHVNDAACHMHRMEREQVLALKPWEVLNISRAELESMYDRLIVAGGFSSLKCRCCHSATPCRDGSR